MGVRAQTYTYVTFPMLCVCVICRESEVGDSKSGDNVRHV